MARLFKGDGRRQISDHAPFFVGITFDLPVFESDPATRARPIIPASLPRFD